MTPNRMTARIAPTTAAAVIDAFGGTFEAGTLGFGTLDRRWIRSVLRIVSRGSSTAEAGMLHEENVDLTNRINASISPI
jgi:hypothetical protein